MKDNKKIKVIVMLIIISFLIIVIAVLLKYGLTYKTKMNMCSAHCPNNKVEMVRKNMCICEDGSEINIDSLWKNN